MEPKIHSIYEAVTGTWQYVVADSETKNAVIIDSVLDYDKGMGKVSTGSADKILDLVADQGYIVSKILETHAHADHLTASRYLQYSLAMRQPDHPRPEVCIGQRIRQVQTTMSKIYGVPQTELVNAFDHTFADDETFSIGSIHARVIYLPGHTPDHIGYVIGSNVFTGDSIFNPDVGSARCDFPGGSATDLYRSTQKLLAFPGNFKLFTGHDYPPDTRDVELSAHVVGSKAVPFTTVETQARENKHVKLGTQMDDFVKWRSERDSGLAEPKLLAQAMQVNIRGGRLPTESTDTFKLVDIPQEVARAAQAAAQHSPPSSKTASQIPHGSKQDLQEAPGDQQPSPGRYQGRASYGKEPPAKEKRVALAEDTLVRVPDVLNTMNISEDQLTSTFFSTQLPPLDVRACPGHMRPKVEVRFGDTFVLTRQLLSARPDYRGRVAVLNCASDAELAGGWRHRYGTTQEDALCYSSTLWSTLNKWKENYPWRKVRHRNASNLGECAGVFSPNVVIVKDELAKECEILQRKEWTTISVVSVAALACPPVVPATQTSKRNQNANEMQLKLDKDVKTIKERWSMSLRMAGKHEKSVLVLAALGCGVWKCPPRQVVELLQECLGEPEFEGWFEEI